VRRALAAALAILLVALGLSAAIAAGRLPNPIVYLRGDAATLVALAGLLLGLALAGAGWARQRRLAATQRLIESLRQEAAAERRRFLGRLDHELKNPLTAIHAGLANLSEPQSATTVASIRTQTVRLSRLVADLRKLAELETLPLEEEPVELAPLLEDVYQAAQDQPTSQSRTITCSLPVAPWPLPSIQGDADLLFLAFYNLLDNAIKFSRPGDRIELRASESEGAVTVDVADTGVGIAAEDLPAVWEELFRGQAARGIPGSGLGLSLTRAIIARHHGSVQVRSRPEQGTVVSVRLPARVTKS
jgi:two-component system, OmpR family, sensor kinase